MPRETRQALGTVRRRQRRIKHIVEKSIAIHAVKNLQSISEFRKTLVDRGSPRFPRLIRLNGEKRPVYLPLGKTTKPNDLLSQTFKACFPDIGRQCRLQELRKEGIASLRSVEVAQCLCDGPPGVALIVIHGGYQGFQNVWAECLAVS